MLILISGAMDQLSDLCRTCLASSKCLESLDTECEQGYSLKFMLTSFCTLQMDDISGIYDNICKDCSSEILRAYNFKLQCEQNDVLLREKARALKHENVFKKEEYSNGEVCIVKREIDNNHYYFDEDKSNVHVKEEDCMEGDDHRRSDDDETLNSDDHKKLASKKKKKPLKTSAKTSSTSAQSTTESVVKGKCGRKKKPIPEEKALLIDNSFQRLGYKRVYECPKCGNLCGTFNLIHKHLDKVHDIVLKSVEEFDEMCVQERKVRGIQESQEEDKVVTKEDANNKMYKCIECPQRCKEFEVMKKHIVQQHREAKYIYCCEEHCKFRTHELVCLVRHINSMHRNNSKFNCELCDFRTHSKYSFDLHHITKHLNIRPFVCHLCAKDFRSNQSLQKHIAVKHEKERKYSCPVCTKSFSIQCYLKEHMKTHTGVKPNICEHCGRAFLQKANLDKHVFIMHTSSREKNLPCPQCSFKATNIYSLKLHMSRHTKKTRFTCDYCGKDFSTKDGVKSHIWRHLNWRPFKCASCPYSCYGRNHLKRHEMKHTGERPFPCQLCDYRSKTKRRLESHMECHMNQQNFACERCPYTANHWYSLRRHLKVGKCGNYTRNYKQHKSKIATDFT